MAKEPAKLVDALKYVINNNKSPEEALKKYEIG
jgi:hypothetical protein